MFDVMDYIDMAEVDDLFNDASDLSTPLGPRLSLLREARTFSRLSRRTILDRAATADNRNNIEDMPSTSSGSRRTNRLTITRNTQRGQKRKRTSRRTRKVIIEYEIEGNGKIPVTKRYTMRKKKVKLLSLGY